MSTDQSTNLGLPFLMPAQAQKHVTVNESLLRLDALVQAGVESRTVASQPGSPADGAVWILPAGKSGAEWGGYGDGRLAYYRDGSWESITPREGWRVWVKDEDVLVRYDGSAWTADWRAASVNGGPLAGLRNAVINGDFRIAQRGAGPFTWGGGAGNVRTLDRWFPYLGASGDQVQRITAPSGLTRASECAYALEFAAPVAASYQYLEQRIEDVRTFAGRTVTLSFDAWAAAAMTLARIQVVQVFGSGGSAAVDTVAATNLALSTAPARKSFSLILPSVAGKTLGAGHALWLQFLINGGSAANAGTLRIADVQLEPGPIVTPFELRPLALEEALCRRYFWRGGQGAAGAFSTTMRFSGSIVFPTPMRAAPTVTLASGSQTALQYGVSSRTAASPTLDSAATDALGGFIEIGGFSGATAGDPATLRTSLIDFSAEL